jgi:hypothetical protein
MTFHRVSPNSHFRSLRLLSECGRWELGLSPYSNGMRLRMGLAGRPPQVMDFCLGRNEALFPQVLVAVVRRLEAVGGNSTAEVIDAAFPWAGTRPDLREHLAELLNWSAEFNSHESPYERAK